MTDHNTPEHKHPHWCRDCIVILHRHMTELDYIYASSPTPQTNLTLCRAQRAYYRMLTYYNRATYTPNVARHRIAANLLYRALWNAKRERDNRAWQDMAQYRVQQARHVLSRCDAMLQASDEQQSVPKPPIPALYTTPRQRTPTPTKLKRVIHPITRRYVYRAED